MKTTTEFVALSRRDALFLTEATDIQAVFQSGGSPIITRRQNLFIFDEESTYLPSKAGGAFGDEMSDIHEIFFPRRAMRMNLFFLFLFQVQASNRYELLSWVGI
jgi:hypothetical protein